MKKLLSLALAALCAATVFTSCASKERGTTEQAVAENPGLEVAEGLTSTVEKTFESTPLAVVNKVTDAGNIHFELSTSIEGQKMSYEFWASEKDPRMALKLDAMGIDATAYLNAEAFVVECKKLLGNTAYGIGFKDLVKNLEKSELIALMGIDVDDMIEDLDVAFDAIEQIADMTKTAEKSAEEFEENIYKIISDEGNYTASEKKFSVNDGEVLAVVLDYKVTPELIMDIVEEYFTYIYEENPIMDMYGSMMGVDFDYMAEEALEEMEYEIEEAFEEADYDYIPVTVVLNKATSEVVYVEITNKEDEKMYLDLGKDPAKSEQWIFGVEDDGEEFEVVITKKFNGNNGEFSIVADDETLLLFELKNSKFVLEVDDEEILTGTCKYSKNSLELVLDGIANGEDVKVVIDAEAAPRVPGYKEILKLTMAEIQQIATKIQANAMSVMGGMGY